MASPLLNQALEFMSIFISLAILVIVIVWNLVVTMRVAKSFAYTKNQKVFQYCLIWVLPIIGAAFCYALANEDSVKTPFHSENENRVEDTPGADIWYGHSGHDTNGY